MTKTQLLNLRLLLEGLAAGTIDHPGCGGRRAGRPRSAAAVHRARVMTNIELAAITVRAEEPPYFRMPDGLTSEQQAEWQEARCEGSNGRQSQPLDKWAGAEVVACLSCGHVVKYRIRATDLPPWGRVMPHRRNGKATR